PTRTERKTEPTALGRVRRVASTWQRRTEASPHPAPSPLFTHHPSAYPTEGGSSNFPSPPLFHRRPPKRGTPPIANESSPSLSDSPTEIVVPTAVDQDKPSRRANIFSLKSSSKPLKNPRQWRSKCGDRPPSSSPPVAIAIVVSASSGEPLLDYSRTNHPCDLTTLLVVPFEPSPFTRRRTPSPGGCASRCCHQDPGKLQPNPR
uniref:Uncharacterized protein n=1 Tax=Oryza rufipogon TaxID=4529 RepID=A0A0E0P6N8_ORYRU